MLTALNELNRGLAAARDLEEVVELASATLHAMLPGRGVLVQLWSRGDAAVLESGCGPEMSTDLCGVELTVEGERVGEITVDARGAADQVLSDDELAWIRAVADAVAHAACARRRRRDHRDAQLATVLALTGLLERREPTLGRHFERMRSHCRTIASELGARGVPGVDDDFVEDLSCACILHDLGKVAIPDSILMKPGRLSPEEWEITKTHTLLGAATLEDVLETHGDQEILALGRDIALQHHERWNGGGYPNGLAGEAISLAARIVAVVDVFDALTHHRPFRPAWTHERAVEWIRHRAGEEFDPEVVECFLARADEIEAVSRRMADVDPYEAGLDAALTR